MYHFFFSQVFSRMDPERAHHWAFCVIRILAWSGIGQIIRLFTRPHPQLAVTTLGKRFPSPFGIAAGFDKNGEAVMGLGQLGFGHIEVGTITALPQQGNPKPRMFRLLQDRALINRMGFNNRGAEHNARLLHRVITRKNRPVVGVNIGKSRVVNMAHAVEDYCVSARSLAPVADYLVVNVSSPNTPGLRGLQEIEKLGPLLAEVKKTASESPTALPTPLLVKIAPDLTDEQIDAISRLVMELHLDGIIATNTTIHRHGLVTPPKIIDAAGAGGLSGAPLSQRSLEVLVRIRKILPPEMCVISVGGVATAADIVERLNAGATLVQGYTEFVYNGPLWARKINKDLRKLLGQEHAID